MPIFSAAESIVSPVIPTRYVFECTLSQAFAATLDFERTRSFTVATMTTTAFRFGTTDTHLTPVALGTMVFGTQTPEDDAHRILDHYISEVTPRFTAPDGSPARGMIDTADCYSWWDVRGDAGGHSERTLGRWLARSGARDSVFLSTKGTGLIDDIDAVWDGDHIV